MKNIGFYRLGSTEWGVAAALFEDANKKLFFQKISSSNKIEEFIPSPILDDHRIEPKNSPDSTKNNFCVGDQAIYCIVCPDKVVRYGDFDWLNCMAWNEIFTESMTRASPFFVLEMSTFLGVDVWQGKSANACADRLLKLDPALRNSWLSSITDAAYYDAISQNDNSPSYAAEKNLNFSGSIQTLRCMTSFSRSVLKKNRSEVLKAFANDKTILRMEIRQEELVSIQEFLALYIERLRVSEDLFIILEAENEAKSNIWLDSEKADIIRVLSKSLWTQVSGVWRTTDSGHSPRNFLSFSANSNRKIGFFFLCCFLIRYPEFKSFYFSREWRGDYHKDYYEYISNSPGVDTARRRLNI